MAQSQPKSEFVNQKHRIRSETEFVKNREREIFLTEHQKATKTIRKKDYLLTALITATQLSSVN